MQQGKEGFLPLTQPMAHAQIDFGTFKYIDAYGINQVAYALTITFPYSNKGYTQVFKAQNQECLLEGMQRIFGYIGGSPIRIKADNMSTAVAKILEGGKRELAEGFQSFHAPLPFSGRFLQPGQWKQKKAQSKTKWVTPVENSLCPSRPLQTSMPLISPCSSGATTMVTPSL